MKEKIKKELNFLKENNNKTFSYTLIFVTIILFIYCYFGSFSFFESNFASCKNLAYCKIIYHNIMAFILFFGVGSLFTKFVLKKPLGEFGLNYNNVGLGAKLCLIAIPICVLCGLSSCLDSSMQSTYPLINLNIYGEWYFIISYYISYLFYYIGWEYLFRGILYFGSEEKCGAMASILITTLVSSLIHTSIGGFGKPMIETLSAIPAGIIFGFIVYKTRSITYTTIIHFFVGLFTDICIFFIAK